MSELPERIDHTDSGQDLALSLAVAVRTGAYYDADNAVMEQSCALLASLLASHIDRAGSVTIGVHSHCVFVDRSRVRTSVSTYGRYAYLIQLFDSWSMSTLTFTPELTKKDLMQSLLLLARERRTGPDHLAEMLQTRGVRGVQVDAMVGSGQSQAIAPVEAYAAALEVSEEMQAAVDSGEPTKMRRMRHITQAVVDQVLSDRSSLLALTTIKDFDRYLIAHSTNVAVLSVLLGQRLGLSKSRLGELCLSAFLHDAGKLDVSADVLHKPGPLGEEEWEEMRRHPVMAARSLLEGRRLTPSGMRAVIVAFEHHLNYDMSGYPATEVKNRVTLFGSIVAIADCYDAMTTARPYREQNLTPPQALEHVLSHAGTLFDPMLVKLFVEIMGLYPPGTLLELSSGELGVVCAAPVIGRPLDRPKVRVVAGGEPGTVLDLDEMVDDQFVREVERVLNPANNGLLPAIDVSLFEGSR